MRLITKLAALLRPGKTTAPAAVYQLNIFCVHADLTMLRVQAAKQLHARGLEVERIALTAGDNDLACLSVLFACPDAASRCLNQLAAHFCQLPQVNRVHWARHAQRPRVPNRAFLLAQRAHLAH
ncbi:MULTISPECIES: hypothetical protein [Chromobacterium]|uniref:Uncharacterized protein n=1 Tax=Chromobacterium fluminis TaxID=3044269 RepID=A0ABX0KZN4_9NEIS|nr:hypothetical protein [Chromobacterium haemolyticum]NHR04261.1 hypothetical protein [Chromobacterium haemolyticum]PTU70286.1 hypothetical protein DBB33_12925 [Chromobacterium haemolyticum]